MGNKKRIFKLPKSSELLEEQNQEPVEPIESEFQKSLKDIFQDIKDEPETIVEIKKEMKEIPKTIEVKAENKEKFEENVKTLINNRNKVDMPQTFTEEIEIKEEIKDTFNHLLKHCVSNKNLRIFSKDRSKGPVHKVNNKLSSTTSL